MFKIVFNVKKDREYFSKFSFTETVVIHLAVKHLNQNDNIKL